MLIIWTWVIYTMLWLKMPWVHKKLHGKLPKKASLFYLKHDKTGYSVGPEEILYTHNQTLQHNWNPNFSIVFCFSNSITYPLKSLKVYLGMSHITRTKENTTSILIIINILILLIIIVISAAMMIPNAFLYTTTIAYGQTNKINFNEITNAVEP